MENLFIGNYKKWIFQEDQPLDKQFTDKINIPECIVKLLNQRGLFSQDEILHFLHPDLNKIHDPFLMSGMESSVDRIVRAMEAKERILVYGDYDVDGVSATAILVRYLRKNGIDVGYYIPDRIDEGYGISDNAVEYICDNGFELVITVDCGVTARFQVEAIYERCLVNNKSIDIIITDHHQYHDGLLPEAYAVINPHIPGCNYPFKNLCGAGIALKLIQAIGTRKSQPEAFLEYIDLAALATVADIVELKDENRIIVKHGIEKINLNGCLGIKSLLKAANTGNEPVDSFRMSFLLAPRVNAAGRMGDAKRAVDLFITDDETEADKIAEELNQINTLRQEVQDDIFKQAVMKIEDDLSYKTDKVLVVSGEGWHFGVIGIVASKLVDRYGKPAFVLSVEGDKAVGSGRSIESFNLFQSMEALSSLLIKFGGHDQAGGLTLMAEDVDCFRSRINEYAKELITEDMLVSAIRIDARLNNCDISMRTARQLALLEPYGQGNHAPVMFLRGVKVADKKMIGNNGKHLRLKIGVENQIIDAVYFGKGNFDTCIQNGDVLDIVFSLEINQWQGREYLQLRIIDMRFEESMINRNRFLMEAARRFELLECDFDWLYNGIIEKIVRMDDILVNRDDLIVIYKYIMRLEAENLRISDLFRHARLIEKESGRTINFYKLILALLIFDELELISFSLKHDGSYGLIKNQEPRKVNLEDSELFSYLKSTTEACG